MYEGITAVFYPLWILLAFCNGLLMEKLCAPFLQLRPGTLWKAALILCFAGSSGMVIWVGDPNLFYTLPVFLAVFFACTRGDWAGRLAALREVYYQGLQGQEDQVRRLRHDLRNHLTALQGLLARGQTGAADGYLKQLLDSEALHGRRRLCENETADIVLSAKAQAMEQAGVNARFGVSLPKDLPLAPTDLCALLGNALDNALEAARQTPEGWVSVRARADKGLLMLQVENSAPGLPVREKTGRFATTKADKSAHGFGLAGMEEIARRCGGTLEAKAEEGRFALTVCIPLAPSCENGPSGV